MEYLAREARHVLLQWFEQHRRDPRMEVEARVKDVDQAGFEAVMASLWRNRGWSNTPAEHETIDLMHATGVRETIDVATQQRTFLRKGKSVQPLLVQATAQCRHAVRFAISSEFEAPRDDSDVVLWRRKRRVSFVHKGMFAFELTRVNQGPTEQAARLAPVQHEIELEFCGQRLAEGVPGADYLADSLLMKVADLLRLLLDAARGGGPAAKRQRGGGVEEGTPVRLRDGSEVKLAVSTQGHPPPFNGMLPAELAATVPWVYSHAEEGAAPQAVITNLPCTLGAKAYPLFYLRGRVPTAALVVGGQ